MTPATPNGAPPPDDSGVWAWGAVLGALAALAGLLHACWR